MKTSIVKLGGSFILLICFYSCENNNYASQISPTILVLPYTDIDTSIVNKTIFSLKRILPNIVLHVPVALPQNTYYKPRGRYRADSLLAFQSKLVGDDTVVIGMTSRDISTTKNDVVDWGVMGLGFCPGNACVISSFRLTPSNKVFQFYKVAVHELGHTQGLPHCPQKFCYMRNAEGGNPLDEETTFCDGCRRFLIKKGWHFN